MVVLLADGMDRFGLLLPPLPNMGGGSSRCSERARFIGLVIGVPRGLCCRLYISSVGRAAGGGSPVVQIGPVGGPPRRSADKTPNPPPVVRKKNLQVASSTRGREARKKPVVQVIRTVKRVRNFTFSIWRSPVVAQIEAVGRTKVDDEDGDGDSIDIDSDSGLPGIQCVFPRPTRSSWRPRSI